MEMQNARSRIDDIFVLCAIEDILPFLIMLSIWLRLAVAMHKETFSENLFPSPGHDESHTGATSGSRPVK